MTIACEYNPARKCQAQEPAQEGDCQNEASVSLGRDGKWHLCEACAALPEFGRYRVRKRIHPGKDGR